MRPTSRTPKLGRNQSVQQQARILIGQTTTTNSRNSTPISRLIRRVNVPQILEPSRQTITRLPNLNALAEIRTNIHARQLATSQQKQN